jgi:hypothetical protein
MKSLMKNLALAAALLTASAAHAADEEGCSRDTDCKSQRICVQRQCVWPGEPPSDVAPPAGVVSSQPPPPPPPGYYPEPPRSPPPYARREGERHRGLFLRLDIGAGYMGSSFSDQGDDFTIAGVAVATSFAIGGTVARNQALAFHFWALVTTDPRVSVNGGDAQRLGNNSATALVAFGPEYNIYSQQNWYFSVTPSLTRLHFDDGQGDESDSNWGFGAQFAVGKEWWVGDKWGLGLVAQFSFSSNTDQGTDAPTITTFGGALLFSATWN